MRTEAKSDIPARSEYTPVNFWVRPEPEVGDSDTTVGGPGTIVVGSVAVGEDAPPPVAVKTLAVLTCGELAFVATLTVTVIAP